MCTFSSVLREEPCCQIHLDAALPANRWTPRVDRAGSDMIGAARTVRLVVEVVDTILLVVIQEHNATARQPFIPGH